MVYAPYQLPLARAWSNVASLHQQRVWLISAIYIEAHPASIEAVHQTEIVVVTDKIYKANGPTIIANKFFGLLVEHPSPEKRARFMRR